MVQEARGRRGPVRKQLRLEHGAPGAQHHMHRQPGRRADRKRPAKGLQPRARLRKGHCLCAHGQAGRVL